MACLYCGLEVSVPWHHGSSPVPLYINHTSQSECFQALNAVISILRSEAQSQRGRAEELEQKYQALTYEHNKVTREHKELKDVAAFLEKERAHQTNLQNHSNDILYRFLKPIGELLNTEEPPNEAIVRQAKDLAVNGYKEYQENTPRRNP